MNALKRAVKARTPREKVKEENLGNNPSTLPRKTPRFATCGETEPNSLMLRA